MTRVVDRGRRGPQEGRGGEEGQPEGTARDVGPDRRAGGRRRVARRLPDRRPRDRVISASTRTSRSSWRAGSPSRTARRRRRRSSSTCTTPAKIPLPDDLRGEARPRPTGFPKRSHHAERRPVHRPRRHRGRGEEMIRAYYASHVVDRLERRPRRRRAGQARPPRQHGDRLLGRPRLPPGREWASGPSTARCSRSARACRSSSAAPGRRGTAGRSRTRCSRSTFTQHCASSAA